MSDGCHKQLANIVAVAGVNEDKPLLKWLGVWSAWSYLVVLVSLIGSNAINWTTLGAALKMRDLLRPRLKLSRAGDPLRFSE